jgi:hypothetical protein
LRPQLAGLPLISRGASLVQTELLAHHAGTTHLNRVRVSQDRHPEQRRHSRSRANKQVRPNCRHPLGVYSR